jgi:hypothetical protein
MPKSSNQPANLPLCHCTLCGAEVPSVERGLCSACNKAWAIPRPSALAVLKAVARPTLRGLIEAARIVGKSLAESRRVLATVKNGGAQ